MQLFIIDVLADVLLTIEPGVMLEQGMFIATETEAETEAWPEFAAVVAKTVLCSTRRSCSNSSTAFSIKSIPVIKDDKG